MAMPEKVVVKPCASVTARLAKEVEHEGFGHAIAQEAEFRVR
jgi:hypothetical protein